MISKPALYTGLQGIQTNMNGLHKTAHEVATAGVPKASAGTQPASSLEESLVDLRLYELGAQASAKVVKAADEMLGTLLDTTA